MIIFRKPIINAPTNSERIWELKRALDTLIDELNIAIDQITKEIDNLKEGRNGEE